MDAANPGSAFEFADLTPAAPPMFLLEHDIAHCLRSCLHTICRRQWRTLCGEGEPSAAAIVDPEALVVMSLATRREPGIESMGIEGMMTRWAAVSSRLLNLQRLRNLLHGAPPAAQGGLRWFAEACAAAGDRRFTPLAGPRVRPRHPPGHGPSGNGRAGRVESPAALMLRLRAVFGLGNKADLLAFALGSTRAGGGQRAITLAAIAQSLVCSIPAARRAAGELVHAGLLHGSRDRPTLYSLQPPAEALAGTSSGGAAPWRDWALVMPFLLQALELAVGAAPGLGERLLRLARAQRGGLARCGAPGLHAWIESGQGSLLAAQHFVVGVTDWILARV
jgi:hypothetical protein